MNEYFFKQNLAMYGKDIIINNNIKTRARFKELEESTKFYGQDYKYMFAEHGEINQGDTIDGLNQTWLIINEGENYNNIYDKCVVARASIIKIFINDKLHEIPCIIETFNQSVDDGKYMSLPIGSIKLTIPLNEFTKNITYNNRFIKMDNAWEVVGFTSEHKGLKYLYCKKTQFANTDDKENEIANAKDNIHTYKLNIINKSPILINTTDKFIKIEIEAIDNNKKVEKPVLIYSIDKENIAKIEDNKIIPIQNGTCKLTIKYENIEKSIDIHIIEQQTNHFTVKIAGNEQLAWGRKATYKVTLKNNEHEYKEKVEFTLVDKETKKATKLAKIIKQDNAEGTCTIQANNTQDEGTVILQTKTITGEIQEKEIEIISAWLI
ncbi:hypothetical protein G8T75_12740 [Clostridium botulinum D/C]|uniref:hypothetical protein n=1 Tax=Clostridium botulinum TaxID=1491 RepID=UPI001E5E6769|nr:hypothetical protein [Clostridium botulinum]MCD3240824.1 hypothetical protein [Clostridium botulinum D/C]